MSEHGRQQSAPGHWRRSVAVVTALVRRGDQVLVVRNRGVDGSADRWSLPGGNVHEGELLTDAVCREVHEETGLTIHAPGPIAVYSEHFIPAFREAMTMVAFEVFDWSGTVHFDADPDGDVLDCVFVEPTRAAALTEASSSFGPVWRPIAAYLRGERIRSWFWRIAGDGGGGDAPVAAV